MHARPSPRRWSASAHSNRSLKHRRVRMGTWTYGDREWLDTVSAIDLGTGEWDARFGIRRGLAPDREVERERALLTRGGPMMRSFWFTEPATGRGAGEREPGTSFVRAWPRAVAGTCGTPERGRGRGRPWRGTATQSRAPATVEDVLVGHSWARRSCVLAATQRPGHSRALVHTGCGSHAGGGPTSRVVQINSPFGRRV